MRGGIKSKERRANEALAHAGNHAFDHRKDKKGDFRRLWTGQINAVVRPLGLSYSKFIAKLKAKDVKLNRKMLGHLAEHHPETIERVVKDVV